MLNSIKVNSLKLPTYNKAVTDIPIAHSEAQPAESAVYEGTYPLAPAVAKLLAEVKSFLPNVRFVPSHITVVSEGFVYDEGYIFVGTERYARGFISYRDIRITRKGTYQPTYNIYSHAIANNKYDSYRDEYKGVMSKNLSTAIRNAKRYLTQVPLKSIIDYACKEYIRDRRSDAVYEHVRKSYDEVKSAAFSNNNNEIHKELISLRKSGVAFTNTELQKRVDAFISAANTFAEVSSRLSVGAVVYQHTTIHGKTVYQVYTTELLRNNPEFSWNTLPLDWSDDALDTPIIYTETDIPEHIHGRVSVLSMMEKDNYVFQVGIKVDDFLYFVEFDKNEITTNV